jgi:hypothetical protein
MSIKSFLMLRSAVNQKSFLPLDWLTIRLSFQQVEGESLGGSACWKVRTDCVLVRFAAQKGGKTKIKAAGRLLPFVLIILFLIFLFRSSGSFTREEIQWNIRMSGSVFLLPYSLMIAWILEGSEMQ